MEKTFVCPCGLIAPKLPVRFFEIDGQKNMQNTVDRLIQEGYPKSKIHVFFAQDEIKI